MKTKITILLIGLLISFSSIKAQTATAPTTTDNCAGIITGTTSNPLTYTEQGTYTITWNFNDENGNSINVEQTIIVEDITNPTITCLDNQEVTADNTHNYTVVGIEFDPTATDDNCEGESVTNDFNSSATLAGETLPEGTTAIVWTITDIAGNETTCEFDVLVNAFVGISDLSEIEISMYPNPTNSIFILNFEKSEGLLNISITDITGKIVLTSKIEDTKTSKINLSSLAKGVYFIRIQNKEVNIIKKIIKN